MKQQVLAFLGLIVLSACGGNQPAAATPENVQARVDAIFWDVVGNATASLEGLGTPGQTDELDETLNAITSAFGGEGISVVDLLGPVTSVSGGRLSSLETVQLENPFGRMFNPELVESSDGQTIIFDIDPNVACDGLQDNGSCSLYLDILDLRVIATLVGADGVDITMTMGRAEHEAITLELRPGTIGIGVDLDAAFAALGDLGFSGLGATLGGAFSLTVESVTPETVGFSLGILRDLAIEYESNGEVLTLNAASADPLLRLDAGAGGMSLVLGARDVDLVLPASQLSTDATGLLEIHIGGFRGAIALEPSSGSLDLADLSLGDTTTTIDRDGTRLLSLDLNEDLGRSLTASISGNSDGVTVALTPGLELFVDLALDSVADLLMLEPQWLNNSIGIAASGDDGVILSASPAATPQLQVVEGSLVFTADDELVSVAAGQCLDVAELDSGTDQVWAGFGAAACQ